MRVLIINSVCASGSTGRICWNLSEKIRVEGGEAVIAYGRHGDVPAYAAPHSRRIGTDLDVRVHGLMTRGLDAHGFGSRKATEEFAAWLRQYDPDIIHLHNIHGYYMHVGVLFKTLKDMKKPVIWTLHDCWAFTGHCAHYTHIGCEKWLSGCHQCALKKEYPGSLLLDRSAKNYEEKKRLFILPEHMTLVTPSDWLAGEVQRSFLGAYPVETIHNGIDTGIFRPTESDILKKYGLSGKKIALGVAGVWNESKGLNQMLRLAEHLGEDWAVVLVGLSERQIAELPACVTGLPKTADTGELAAWYSAADVFVNPTVADTFPTTNLEAQACGTPVVTFSAGGSPETVYPPMRKQLVCGNTQMETLAERVRYAAGLDKTQRQEIAAWAKETYNPNTYLEKYYHLYRSLL